MSMLESIKIANFEKDCPGDEFPEVLPCDPNDCSIVRQQFKRAFGLVEKSSGLELIQKVVNQTKAIPNVNAENSEFSLRETLASAAITPGHEVTVNWHRFDDMDRISFDALSRYFDYIWYPKVDHIDIFDDSFSWIVSIGYSGDVSVWKAA